jgi:serine/threonine-protein kinase
MSDPRIGTSIGGYEIETLLGRGGMGVVYLARQTRLDRKVALKVLAPEYASDDNFRTRFVRESQMAASIDHPNVIPVYDADETDGVLFIAMRYVEGTDLKKLIQSSGALEPDRVAAIIAQIAGALDAAHSRGLIHRDVKPANVLVSATETGPDHVYLTDFGLTKHGSSRSGLTATGAFVGTIDYIAPEQIEGKSVDARTDIYALGCVLFECLTGDVPFKKDADVAVMYAHLMDPRPRASEARPGLPVEVDAVLAKAMARDPGDRYGTASDLVADLRRALGAPASATPIAPAVSIEERPLEDVVETKTPAPAPVVRRRFRVPGKFAAIGVAVLFLALATLVTLVVTNFIRGGTGDDPGAPASSDGSAGRSPSTPVDAIPSDAIFVSPQGTTGAAGTEGEPVADLTEGVRMAGDGGTVILADGTYEATGTPMLLIDHPVTIRGATGATPILQGSDTNPDGIRIAAGTSDVTLSNLSLKGFLGDGLKVFCSKCEDSIENRDVTLEELEFTGGGTPLTIENVAGLTLQRVDVHDNNATGLICSPGPCDEVTIVDSFFHSAGARFAEGVRIENGNDVLIETSDLSSNPGNGLYSNASSTRVLRSRFQDNGGAGAILSGSDSEIRDSIAARNGEEGLILGEGGCDGVCSATGTFTVANVLSADNLLGISIENDNQDEIAFEMFNTIVTSNDGTALRLVGAVRVERLDKNLFHTTPRYLAIALRREAYDEGELNNGLFPGNVDAGTYATAPEFVATDDYHLAPDSAGVDDGTEDGVTSEVDIDGNPRVAGGEIDRGPYEQ